MNRSPDVNCRLPTAIEYSCLLSALSPRRRIQREPPGVFVSNFDGMPVCLPETSRACPGSQQRTTYYRWAVRTLRTDSWTAVSPCDLPLAMRQTATLEFMQPSDGERRARRGKGLQDRSFRRSVLAEMH